MSSSRRGSDTGERLTSSATGGAPEWIRSAENGGTEKLGIIMFALGIAFIIGGAVLIWLVVSAISG